MLFRSVYIRHHFTATATEATSNFPLSLSADYDDGAIVYLNGIEIFRSNLGTPGVPFPHDNVATADRPANGDLGVPRNPEISTLAPAKNLLVTGENVLSIQLHNASLTSSDAIATMILSSTGSAARTLVSPTDPLRYFVGVTEPTVPTQSQAEDSAEPDSGPADSESDWIELKNTTAAAISLAGWSLSDDASNPRLWSFPPTASIPANGHLLVLASGLNLLPNIDATTYLHTNFKLSSSGDIVILTRPDNTIADQFTANYPPQSWRYSYGRQADGTFGYLETATPGQVNSSTALIPAPDRKSVV